MQLSGEMFCQGWMARLEYIKEGMKADLSERRNRKGLHPKMQAQFLTHGQKKNYNCVNQVGTC